MLCAISPAADQFEETLNTLKYANRAKQMAPPQATVMAECRLPHTAWPEHFQCHGPGGRGGEDAGRRPPSRCLHFAVFRCTQVPQRQEQQYNPVQEQVQVLTQLQDTLHKLTGAKAERRRPAFRPLLPQQFHD